MKFKTLLKVIVILFCLQFTFLFVNKVKAEDCTGSLDQKISCYESNISKLKDSSKTLSTQISQFDAQIQLAALKIAQTEERINLLTGRIDQIEGSLGSLTNAFSERAVETYKMARVGDPFVLIISADDLTEAYNRLSYLKKIQEGDRNLLVKLQNAHDEYEEEKVDQEDLQKELADQKRNLDSQKNAKAKLLAITKNDEKRYQVLLSQALAEKAAIEKALVNGTKVGPVNTGDPIALVGNSGYPSCSTGKHLHFEVRKNGGWTDPAPYLQNKTIQDEERGGSAAVGSGSWQWPIQDPIRLTQHYGHTPYSSIYAYSGGIHTGFDMVSSSSDVIRAPAPGNLFRSTERCGSSTINIVYIEHGDGVISFYLHVQ